MTGIDNRIGNGLNVVKVLPESAIKFGFFEVNEGITVMGTSI